MTTFDAFGGMSDLRLFGVALAALLVVWTVWRRRARRLTNGESVMSLAIAAGLTVVAVWPHAVDGVMHFAGNRLLTLAILSNLVLFGLFLFSIRQSARTRESLSELVRSLARTEFDRYHGMAQEPGVLVVIPAYNEERSLVELLPRVPSEIGGAPVRAVVIVDGGQDRSMEVVRRVSVSATAHPINQGQGDAIRTGFDLAMRQGADIVVTMDADGQHEPEELGRLVEPILMDRADLVLGSRFAGSYEDRGGVRHAGIVVYSWLLRLLTGLRISDCTNGYRAIRVSSLRLLALRERRFSAPEILVQAAACGLRVLEVPVTVRTRAVGESKKPPGWRYATGFGLVMVRTWLRS